MMMRNHSSEPCDLPPFADPGFGTTLYQPSKVHSDSIGRIAVDLLVAGIIIIAICVAYVAVNPAPTAVHVARAIP